MYGEIVVPRIATVRAKKARFQGKLGMNVPRNSVPMVGKQGKYDYIDMGGMFAIVKVRENLTSYDDPGWYEAPPGTLANLASNDELQRDLGHIPDGKS